MPRSRDSFDFGWKFLQGDAPGAQKPDFADATWRDVDLPHDWSIEGRSAENEPSGGNGAYLPTGIGWYRKRFRLPAADRGRVVPLEFDGVYQNSEVWINGQYLGKRPYGYIRFAYELTPHLNFDAENVVAVKVDNSRQTDCRWYSGSGIYRHTWLLPIESGARRALGNVRHHAAGVENIGHRRGRRRALRNDRKAAAHAR